MTRGYCRSCHQTQPPEVSLCPLCGATLVPFPAELDIGDVLPGDLRIVRLLDEGGMGAVFVGVQEGLKREVAVKVIRSALSRDPAVMRRFLDEGPLLAQLEHPNTVRVLQQGRTRDGQLFLVMELLRGRTLRDLLGVEPRLPVERMLRIGVQVCNSLEEAHAKGLVHRDLKPEHIFLQDHPGNPDFVRVFDFGIARSVDEETSERLTQPGMVFGTITYMSPEQSNGDDVDLRSDIYSLGVLFHEVLTGDPIFRSSNPLAVLMRKLTYEPTPIRVKQPELDIPAELDDLIARMLATRADGRPSSMGEVRDVLLRLLSEPRAATPPGPAAAAPADAIEVVEAEPTRIGTRPLLAPRFEIGECLGRAAEKEILLDLVTNFARTGDPRVVIVDGGTGVGKSKLVGWLQRRAAGLSGVRVSRGVFSRFNTAVSLQAVKDAVRSLLDVDDHAGPNEASRASVKISTSLRRWDITDADLAQVLADLIYPGQTTTAPVGQLGQERYWEAAYMGLLTLLREIAGRTRLVLILDDVQWADPRSIEFLQLLLDALRSRSVAVSLVLVVNTEEAEDRDAFSALLVWLLRNLASMTRQLSLKPLSGKDFDDFVNAILPLEPRSRDELFRMSRGNPFFTIELLQFLFNEQQLQRRESHFALVDASERPSAVPLTLKDIVQRKFARFKAHSALADEAMAVLEHVALFNEPLPCDVLEAALETDPTAERVRARLDDVLDALTRERLLKLEIKGNDEAVEPYHPIVTLYLQAELGRGRRGRRIHRAFASTLEARLAKRRDPLALERIAEHHRQAGDGARALPFYQEAGAGWNKRHEYERAMACLGAWLQISEGLDPAGGAERAEVLSLLAGIQTTCGEFGPAEKTWRQVLACCSPDSPDAAYGTALLGLAEIRGHKEANVDDDLRRAARFFRRHGHRRALGRALERLGSSHVDAGRVQIAARIFSAAERILEAEGARHELASLFNRRGLASIHAGRADEALRFFERGLEIQAELGNPVELARAYNNIAIGLMQQGMGAEAERYLEGGLERLGTVNFPAGRISLLLNLGVAAIMRRDFEVALERLDRAYAQAESIYSRRLQARILVNKAAALLELGRFDEALRLASEGQDIYGALNLPVQAWPSTALIGDLYLRKGDIGQARRYLERAYHLAQRLGLRTGNVAEVLQGLAHLYEKEGNATAAARALDEAEQIYSSLRNVSAQTALGERRKLLTGQHAAAPRPAEPPPAAGG